MAAKSKKDPLAALTAIPGVGKATAQKLFDAGMKTPAGIARKGAKGLDNAGISAATAKKILAAVAKKPASKKKSAPKKKAAPKKKPAPKKKVKKKTEPKKKAAPKKKASDTGRKGKDLKAPSLADILKRIKSGK